MDRRLGLTIVRIASVAVVLFAIVYQPIWLVNENLVIGPGLIWLGNLRAGSAGDRLQPAT